MMKEMLQKCFTMGGILLELISEQFNVHAFQSSLCCAAQCSRLTGKDTKSQRLKSWKWGSTGWLGFRLNLKAMRLEINHRGFKGHHLQLAIFSYVSTQGHIGYICNDHTCMCSPVLKSTWKSVCSFISRRTLLLNVWMEAVSFKRGRAEGGLIE